MEARSRRRSNCKDVWIPEFALAFLPVLIFFLFRFLGAPI